MEITACISQALEFVKNKDYNSAEKIYLELLESQPENPIILSFCGYLYLTQSRYNEAESMFEKAFGLSESESTMSGLAITKYGLRKYNEAVSLYISLIKKNPQYEYYEKLMNSFSSIITLKDREYAEMAYQYGVESVKIFPFSKELLLNLSIACLYSGRFQESEKYCADVLKLDSKYAKAWSQAGLIREGLYCDEKGAQACYKKSIKYGIGHSGYYDLGVSLSKTGNYVAALKNFKTALEFLPENETINLAIAHNYFRQRKFKQGYEYYIKQNDSSGTRDLINTWDGKKYKTKTIFVYPDLAFGDHIMFMRYIPFLKEKFKSVKVFVYPQLKRLFESNFDVEFVTEIPEYDYSAALSKLPYYLKMDFSHIPFSAGYLDAAAADISSKRLKVGLCWEAGNSDLRSTIHRSVSINEFKTLFDNNFDIYSFQVNPSNLDYESYSMQDLGKNFTDFCDTARYLKSMDIVVSVDTSVANLAGAMGIKTFMLLPFYSDWRWFDNTEKTEWYDSVRIFKQSVKGSWKNEIARIYSELTKMCDEC